MGDDLVAVIANQFISMPIWVMMGQIVPDGAVRACVTTRSCSSIVPYSQACTAPSIQTDTRKRKAKKMFSISALNTTAPVWCCVACGLAGGFDLCTRLVVADGWFDGRGQPLRDPHRIIRRVAGKHIRQQTHTRFLASESASSYQFYRRRNQPGHSGQHKLECWLVQC